MATYNSNIWNAKIGRTATTEGGEIIFGRVEIPSGTAPATGDILQLFRMRTGQNILAFHFECNDWGNAVPGTLGTSTVDDDAEIDLDSVIADVDLDAAGVKLAFATPLAAIGTAVTEDARVKVVIGTVASGTSSGIKYLNFAAIVGGWPSSAAAPVYTWNGLASNSSATA